MFRTSRVAKINEDNNFWQMFCVNLRKKQTIGQ